MRIFQCAVDKTSRLQGNKTNKNRITRVTSKTIDSRVSSSYTKKKAEFDLILILSSFACAYWACFGRQGD